MRYVSVYELRPGDRLGTILYDAKGSVLLTAGAALTTRSIKGLQERGFLNILIDDEETKGIIINSSLKPEREVSIISNLVNLDIDKIAGDAKNLVKDLIEDNVKIADIEFVKDYDNYTYQHSLSVGYLSAVLGMASGFTMTEIENLTAAGLLHDIGKIKIDKEIINAPRRLTDTEYALVQEHSRFGYDMLLEKEYSISATVRVAVYEHHENEDGTGYPRHVKGEALHKFSKIIHICDVFDALTSDRSYRSPMPRTDAVKYIKDNAGTMFNPLYAAIFEKITPLYPTGTMIPVAPGRNAIIVSNDISELDNPTVRIIGTHTDLKYKDALIAFTKKES